MRLKRGGMYSEESHGDWGRLRENRDSDSGEGVRMAMDGGDDEVERQ